MIIIIFLTALLIFILLPAFIIKTIEEKEEKEWKLFEEGFNEGFEEAKRIYK